MVKLIYFLLIQYLSFFSVYTETMENQLIVDYFQHKNINAIITFLHWNIQDKVALSKLSSQYGIRTLHVNCEPYKQTYSLDHILKSGLAMNSLRVDYNKIGIVFEDKIEDLLVQLANNNYMNGSYAWLIYGEEMNKTIENMEKLNLFIDADVSLAIDEKLSTVKLIDIYNPGQKRGSSLVINDCGFWDKETHKLVYTCFTRYRDAHELPIYAVATRIPSSSINNLHDYLTDRDNPVDSMSMVSYDLLLYLEEYFNLKLQFIVQNTHSDQEVVNTLDEGIADILTTALEIRLGTIRSMDSIYQLYDFRSGFLFLNPDYGSGIENIFLKPFTSDVWVVVFCTIITIAFVLAITFSFETKAIGSFCCNLVVTGLDSLGSICQQGVFTVLSRISGRVVLFTLLMFSTVLYNFYTSSVVSSLLNDKVEYINSLRDLANSDMYIGIEDTEYAKILFETAPNKEVKNLIKKKTRLQSKNLKEFYIGVDDGIAEIKKGTLAYHTEFSKLYPKIAKTFNRKDICNLREIPVTKRCKWTIGSRKGSPFTNIFRIGALRAAESGLLARANRRYYFKTPECQPEPELLPADGGQAAPALVILFVGIAVATLLIVVETILSQKNRNQGKLEIKL